MRNVLLASLVFLLTSCATVPEGVTPIKGFEVNRFLGKWYEVARLNHPFERGMSNVTATYSLKEDGDIRVLNRGYKEPKQRWQTAEGKAKFVSDPGTGQLKVSFFGPFYGGYNIVELDKKGYQYALIVGNDRTSMWILSRTPKLDPTIQKRLVKRAKDLDFPVESLIYVLSGDVGVIVTASDFLFERSVAHKYFFTTLRQAPVSFQGDKTIQFTIQLINIDSDAVFRFKT